MGNFLTSLHFCGTDFCKASVTCLTVRYGRTYLKISLTPVYLLHCEIKWFHCYCTFVF